MMIEAFYLGNPLRLRHPGAQMQPQQSPRPAFMHAAEVNNNNEDEPEYDSYCCCCFIDFDDSTGMAQPYISSLDSESTWVEYNDDGIAAPASGIGQLKEQIANQIHQPTVEVAVAVSVLCSCALVAISTIDDIRPYQAQLYIAENIVNVLFAIDFFGRWFSTSRDFGKHVFDPQFALDVVVVLFPLFFGVFSPVLTTSFLPSWLTNPSALINLELLRVLRLRRVLRNKETFARFERALGIPKTYEIKDWQLQLARVVLSLFTLLSVSTGLIYTAEHQVNPGITNYFDALYFGLCSLSTVGFGDITPITWQGKFIVCGSIIAGVAIVPPQAAALVEALLERSREEKQTKLSSAAAAASTNKTTNQNANLSSTQNDGPTSMVLEMKVQCSNCGASMHWSEANYCWSCGEKMR
jgi:hypothetical protein